MNSFLNVTKCLDILMTLYNSWR